MISIPLIIFYDTLQKRTWKQGDRSCEGKYVDCVPWIVHKESFCIFIPISSDLVVERYFVDHVLLGDFQLFSGYYTFCTSKSNLHFYDFITYICRYSRLSLSRIPRDSLKHFEISVPRHIRVERVRKRKN